MSRIDFDQYSDNYDELLQSSTRLIKNNDEFFATLKLHCIKKWVMEGNQANSILDFGCGIGKFSGLLAKCFPASDIHGYDISQRSLDRAREENSDLKNVIFSNELYTDRKYDFITIANVFHHIKAKERVNTFCKLRELLNPGSRIAIFEHNPLNLMTRYVVNSCPYDSDAELISARKLACLAGRGGFDVIWKRYLLFFPWSQTFFRKAEGLLRHLPLGAQYMLLLAEKNNHF